MLHVTQRKIIPFIACQSATQPLCENTIWLCQASGKMPTRYRTQSSWSYRLASQVVHKMIWNVATNYRCNNGKYKKQIETRDLVSMFFMVYGKCYKTVNKYVNGWPDLDFLCDTRMKCPICNSFPKIIPIHPHRIITYNCPKKYVKNWRDRFMLFVYPHLPLKFGQTALAIFAPKTIK